MPASPPIKPIIPIPDALSQEYLEHYLVLPLQVLDDRLHVAAAGEPDAQALDDLAGLFGADVQLVSCDEDTLREAIRLAMNQRASVIELVSGEGIGPATEADLEEAVSDARDLANQPPVIRFVNLLIRDAHALGASDIHFDAERTGLRVRLRIDGVLSDADGPPPQLAPAVISRIKLLSDLDIAERRVPQDGRIRVRLEDRELDLRVATLPSLFGESVVLRLLDRGGRPVSLDELGMDPTLRDQFAALALRPNGILLVTGPTGSGKTTTLHAALGLRDSAAEKIVTVEDPIEYQLPGVTQVPVNVKAGLSFATVLRSVLRQDPDVVMVGEMRDAETASIAVRAALTGHLVLSTLHTNDAVSAIPRLVDLQVEAYLIASTLEGVLAQRLVRRVCPECREPYIPDPQAVALVAAQPVGRTELVRGAGCTSCRFTGYRGRTGIYELLPFDDELKDLVTRAASRAAIRDAAATRITHGLKRNGWAKIQAGITTVEEVLRVVTN